MSANLRSWGQQTRHARIQRNAEERRKLIDTLKRQEAVLKDALKDIRAVLKELSPY